MQVFSHTFLSFFLDITRGATLVAIVFAGHVQIVVLGEVGAIR